MFFNTTRADFMTIKTAGKTQSEVQLSYGSTSSNVLNKSHFLPQPQKKSGFALKGAAGTIFGSTSISG